jgi:hypothetical protein
MMSRFANLIYNVLGLSERISCFCVWQMRALFVWMMNGSASLASDGLNPLALCEEVMPLALALPSDLNFVVPHECLKNVMSCAVKHR